MTITSEQKRGARREILNTFKNCEEGEERAGYHTKSLDYLIVMELVTEGKLRETRRDEKYAYFAPTFDTFDYVRVRGRVSIPPDERMKKW